MVPGPTSEEPGQLGSAECRSRLHPDWLVHSASCRSQGMTCEGQQPHAALQHAAASTLPLVEPVAEAQTFSAFGCHECWILPCGKVEQHCYGNRFPFL